MPARLTTSEFIQRSKDVHGETRYSYCATKYGATSRSKLTVTCPEHGEFRQRAVHHLQGHEGCQKCVASNISKNNKWTTKDFVRRAKRTHGDRYSYVKSIYVDMEKRLLITCKLHGDFDQTPRRHIEGAGCRDCANTRRGKASAGWHANQNYHELFIHKARLVHGVKYDYSQVVYLNSGTPVDILCPAHGSFSQRPNNHLMGAGCPSCHSEITPTTIEYEYMGRVFYLDSTWEVEALHWLVDVKNVPVTSLLRKGDLGFKVIKYEWRKESHRYEPDFLIPELGRLIEVKSIATLGLVDSMYTNRYGRGLTGQRELFGRTAAKVKTCIDLGYKTTLLLWVENRLDGTLVRLPLPVDWYNSTFKQICEWYKENHV